VIKLNNEPISSEPRVKGSARPSTGAMFIIILLLISGLLLTSIMLFQYSVSGSKGSKLKRNEKTATSKTNTVSVQTSKPVSKEPSSTTPKKESGFSFKKLFSDPTRWPQLKLTGFGLPANGTAGFAIINGEHVFEGNSIKGVTLVKVLDSGVQVEFNGKTKVLIIDISK